MAHAPHSTSAEPLPKDPFAWLPRPDRHRAKCTPVRPSRAGKYRAAVLVLVHVLIGLHIAQWLATGSTTLSPVEPSEAMQGLERGKVNAGFLFFAGAIAATLVVGRFVCGWACHLVALQDLCAHWLGKLGLRPRPLRSRLLVFGPFLVGGYMFVWPQILRWTGLAQLPSMSWDLDLYVDDLWRTFPGWIMAPVSVLVVGFLIVWVLGAKAFCTHGCPYGAFFALADRFAPGRIRVTDACEHCGHCTQVCTSNVRVHEEVAKHGMVVDPGCMKCLDCVSVCPKDALYFGFGKVAPFAVSQQRIAQRADVSWGEEGLLAAVGLAAFFAFRGAWFGESVPLLLSVGLGAITAALALGLWRLLRRSDVTFQHTAWKRAGAWTGWGKVAAVGITGWLVFAAHTGVVRWAGESAERSAWALLRQQRESRDVAPAAFAAAAERLACVDRWSLLTSPIVLGVHGLVLRELAGRTALAQHQGAIAQLERMVRNRRFDRARVPPADVALANYHLAQGKLDSARDLALDVLAHVPGEPSALAILEQIERRR
jgi:ferredoxin-type protein NapH